MNFFSSTTPLQSTEGCTVSFKRADEAPQEGLWGFCYRMASFPFTIPDRIYNTYLLIKHAELREPAMQNAYPVGWLNSFASLFFTMKLASTTPVMKEILHHPRKDPEGLFHDTENAKAYFPLLRDMYPSEQVEENDFLLTCGKDFIHNYRRPILQAIGPHNIKKHEDALKEIAAEIVGTLEKTSDGDSVNATELSLAYTSSVISKLLLGHPGPLETYKEIAHAIGYLNTYAMKNAWQHPISAEEKKTYQEALEVVKSAIDTSLTSAETPLFGSLVKILREEKGMSDLQIKSTLFLMYLGGSETTSSLLTYLLWQLGRHPEYQAQILQGDPLTVEKVFTESIRLFPSAYIIGRQAATDLICTVQDKEGREIFQDRIGKGENLLCAPTFAGRDPSLYKNPNMFDPSRFKAIPKTLPWMPFSDGKHSCPGQWLAKAEILALVTSLVQKYEISSLRKEEPKQLGHFTLKIAEDLWVSLIKRAL